MGDSFLVYDVACADGIAERHGRLFRRSDILVASREATRLDARDCGPHAVVAATVSRSPWAKVDIAAAVNPVQTEPLKHHCPACSAVPGEACINMAKLRHGERVEAKWPHPPRLALWEESLRRKIAESIPAGIADLEFKAACPVCPPGINVGVDVARNRYVCGVCGCAWNATGTGGRPGPDPYGTGEDSADG